MCAASFHSVEGFLQQFEISDGPSLDSNHSICLVGWIALVEDAGET